MRQALPIVLIIALAGVLGWLLFGSMGPDGERHRALDGQGAPAGGGFTLQSVEGPVSLADYRGQVVLLYFGYTWCPDICPTSLSLMSQAFSGLSERELKGVQGIFVSVDPERDTPQRLAEYTAYFHPSIIGVTGTPEEVADVAGKYGVVYRKAKPDANGNYAVDHSSHTYVIGPDGELQARIGHGAAPKRIREVVRELLPDR